MLLTRTYLTPKVYLTQLNLAGKWQQTSKMSLCFFHVVDRENFHGINIFYWVITFFEGDGIFNVKTYSTVSFVTAAFEGWYVAQNS